MNILEYVEHFLFVFSSDDDLSDPEDIDVGEVQEELNDFMHGWARDLWCKTLPAFMIQVC